MANKYAHLAPKKKRIFFRPETWARCLGKRQFEETESALAFAEEVLAKFGDVQVPYRCPYCKHFHLKTKKRHQELAKTS